jgi:molecular chaperone DnaK
LEELTRPLLRETLAAIDRALSDAGLRAGDLDRVILVGGSTRMPLVQELVETHLPGIIVSSFEPDRCVALGAALQAAVLSGQVVDTFLVDVTPHSLGIATAIDMGIGLISNIFSTIIPRNTVIPVSRSKLYMTSVDNQETVCIEVSQGEQVQADENVPLGSFEVNGLPPKPAGKVKVEVQFSFDLNGILTVTAIETTSGQREQLVVNNAAIQRLASHELESSRSAVDSLFQSLVAAEMVGEEDDEEVDGDDAEQDAVVDDLDDEVADADLEDGEDVDEDEDDEGKTESGPTH